MRYQKYNTNCQPGPGPVTIWLSTLEQSNIAWKLASMIHAALNKNQTKQLDFNNQSLND
uniref:Uncharacterized protein n=1 Tax=Arion vulgaris TaxID=1028688 RepID=A0A0B6YU64_9EUPU